MTDILVIALVAVIVGLAVWYVIRARKKGVKCVGCPEGLQCGSKGCGNCSGCGSIGCSCHEEK